MGSEEMTVTISLERYEHLLDTETRKDILSEYIANNNYVDRETVFQILGCPGLALVVREQEKGERKSFSLNGYVGEVTEDAGTD